MTRDLMAWLEQSLELHDGRCEIREGDGSSVCGEPVLIGKVCYDHAKMGPNGGPMCPITGEFGEVD